MKKKRVYDYEDLSGMKFGHLTALSRAENAMFLKIFA